ncbi:hypothetical protein LC065_13270 [Halobacillus litoralis]|uniref:hypothetical protein n=1 Tax=Halobacillus litoralis TaxID=45668 RepID=UPI00273E7E81|nr:hypothetical protein [Halobacillus litoralis]WLR46538.1 hypothetical protein LC065_13270 [Halobacillus litoralis]
MAAEVKLEVWGKFCSPRPNDIKVKDRVECPEITFPEQCPDIFPRQNCDCQAWAMTMLTGQEVAFTGFNGAPDGIDNMTTLHTNICNNCTLSGSTLRYTFKDLRTPRDPDYSFTFKATTFDLPEVCNIDESGDSSMTVTGQGWLKFKDNSLLNRRVSFELVIDTGLGNAGEYTLTLTDIAGNTIEAEGADVPEDELKIEGCVTFED